MTTLAGARTQEELNSVVNNVVVNLSDGNDDDQVASLEEASSSDSVNDVDNFDPLEGIDIKDPFLDKQPY